MRAKHLGLRMAFAGAIVAMSGVSAHAQNLDEQSRRIGFEAADSDGDGRLDEAEIAADTAAAFSALDANNDYRLEPDEVKPIGTDRFKAMDNDGDGKLTFSEVMDDKLLDIEEADRDGDGALSIDEVRDYEESQPGRQR